MINQLHLPCYPWSCPTSRFHPPTSAEVIEQLSSKTFAQTTERKVQWAVSLFDSWQQNCLRLPTSSHEIMFCNIKDPQRVNKSHLAKVLSYFITEVRCKDRGGNMKAVYCMTSSSVCSSISRRPGSFGISLMTRNLFHSSGLLITL